RVHGHVFFMALYPGFRTGATGLRQRTGKPVLRMKRTQSRAVRFTPTLLTRELAQRVFGGGSPGSKFLRRVHLGGDVVVRSGLRLLVPDPREKIANTPGIQAH